MLSKESKREHLENELLLQREINQGLEQALHQALIQSKKDENLIHELVIMNEIWVEAYQKLNTKVNILKKLLKISEEKVKASAFQKEVSPMDAEETRRHAKVKKNILPQFGSRKVKIEKELKCKTPRSLPKP